MGTLLAPDREEPRTSTVACSPQKGDWFLEQSAGYVFALDSTTGHELWRVFLGGSTLCASDLVHRGWTTGYSRVRRSCVVHVRVGRSVVFVVAEDYLLQAAGIPGRRSSRWRRSDVRWRTEMRLKASEIAPPANLGPLHLSCRANSRVTMSVDSLFYRIHASTEV